MPNWRERPWPARTSLHGHFCRVEPLDVERHADTLFAAYEEAPDDRDWTYLPDEPIHERRAFRNFIAHRAVSADPMHMAIVHNDEALGRVAFMRIDAGNGVIEIGHVHFAPRLQRTAAATEALYLMLRTAFDELGYRRLEWKCDSFNEPSRRAALRLGFLFEGLFANALITKGRNRDTAWFAMIDDRWPTCARRIKTWLSPDNFDSDGRQRTRLCSLKDGDV